MPWQTITLLQRHIRRTRHAEGAETVLLPGSWRSVGAHPQALARECCIDEVADHHQ